MSNRFELSIACHKDDSPTVIDTLGFSDKEIIPEPQGDNIDRIEIEQCSYDVADAVEKLKGMNISAFGRKMYDSGEEMVFAMFNGGMSEVYSLCGVPCVCIKKNLQPEDPNEMSKIALYYKLMDKAVSHIKNRQQLIDRIMEKYDVPQA